MAKKVKATLEFLLVKAEVKGIPEKGYGGQANYFLQLYPNLVNPV